MIESFLLAFNLPADSIHISAFKRHSDALTHRLRSTKYQTSNRAPYANLHITCPGCGHTDSRLYDVIPDSAEMVCTQCGAVVVDHMLYQYPVHKHDDEEGKPDTCHFSMPHKYGHIMSDEHELTTMGRSKVNARLRTDDTERNTTTTACKDRDKQRAIRTMEDAAIKLGVCPLAVNDAIHLFANIRDERQRILGKSVQIAACLYVCAKARERRVPIPHVQPNPETFQFKCRVCECAFQTAVMRIKHWDASPVCRIPHGPSLFAIQPMDEMSMYFTYQ
jgi:hypothetical protein